MLMMNSAGTVGWEDIRTRNYVYDVIVTKSLTMLPKAGNPYPHYKRLEYGLINSVGMKNPGIRNYHYWDIGKPVMVSVGGNFGEACDYLEDKDIWGIELNLSCPNIDMLYDVLTIVSRCREISSHRLVVKLGIQDYLNESHRALLAGADMLTLINTIPAYDPEFGTGGLSGPAIKPIALRVVKDVIEHTGADVIGCGGISTQDDVEQFEALGVKAVQIGTGNIK